MQPPSRAPLRSGSPPASLQTAQPAAPTVESAGSPSAALLQRARAGSLSPRDLLQLQRVMGNRAVGRLLAAARPPRPEPSTSGVPAIRPLDQPGTLQCTRGVTRYDLPRHRFPQMPAPQPANWVVGASGPYHVPVRMDAILSPNWDHLAGGGPVNTKFFLDVAARNWQVSALYHRGHVLAQSLKGPAAEHNMVPLTQAANLTMRDQVENPIREYLNDNPERGVLHYRVGITYGQGPAHNRAAPEEHLPARLWFQLREYQSPEDYRQLTDLDAWLANDPEPRDPVGLPAHIDVQLPTFAQPFPGPGLTRSPTLQSVAGAQQEIQAFDAAVHDVVTDLARREIRDDFATGHRGQVHHWLHGLGVGYGISQEDQTPPTVQQGVIANRLQAEIRTLQARHRYLVHADDLSREILEDLDSWGGAVNEPDLLEAWETRIGDVWGEADTLDLHGRPWGAALETIQNLSAFVDGSYIGPNDLQGLNWELEKRLDHIRGILRGEG